MWIRHERLPTGTRPSRAAPLLLPLHLIREITKMHFEMGGVTRNVEQIWRHEENPSSLHRMARCQRQIRSRQSRASAHCGARNHVRNTGYKKKKIAAIWSYLHHLRETNHEACQRRAKECRCSARKRPLPWGWQ